jgi:hypothetical protein
MSSAAATDLTATKTLELRLDDAMLEIYTRAGKEVGY